ncbi:type II toxin-antitoxin system PemK/MazF family toxin [Brachybacterium huguangmaarense]|uniref:Type II toxin-antitoxin system PemK/MazF family toxin n=1 Tax=Brachybacterium huguangmaarense TaxID=1652028 RepID=A0ABY6FYS6_9MICO|nr:type II toxin-antitoxin system PemK/MazF family toxin [Brachybacterium huguangmaarense]UYG16094.1 type II toxin-antitoxin system PemK/MazF family toxin [Brachybacterium huguangmaarense]
MTTNVPGSMLTPGDVVDLDLGAPAGAEAGLRRPAVVITADRVLQGGPNVVQVVPLTRTLRVSGSEVIIEPDEHNGLRAASAAQCQHIRSVATTRVSAQLGNVGPVVLRQIRGIVAIMIDA